VRLELSEPALDDLEEIWQFIALDNDAAATRLVDELLRRLRTIETFPGACRERPELGVGVRSFLIHENYIAYFLERSKEVVSVIRILHARRDATTAFQE
jgi:toxin ParE1/3/4